MGINSSYDKMDKTEKLKLIIQEQYPSVRAFARASGVAHGTIVSALDKGIDGMAYAKVKRMCECLNIDCSTFEPIICEKSSRFTTDTSANRILEYSKRAVVKKAEVSVIVPVYNSEKTISKCLDSILAQTYKKIEIICVNDGSVDDSLAILKKYAESNSVIRVINKTRNEGLVAARKTGVSFAKGKYIGFVDSDDWIEPNMFEKLYEYVTENEVDFVSSGYILEGNYVSRCVDNIAEGDYTNCIIELRNNAIYDLKNGEVGLRAPLWCKLFRREIISNALDMISPTITYAEDKMIMLAVALEAKNAYVTHESFYHYIIYSNSMSHGADSNYLDRVNDVYKQLIKFYNHPNFTDTMRLQAEVYITELLYKGVNSRLGFKNKNLLWIDPYWMNELPGNSKLILYGDGEICEAYVRQIENSKMLTYVATVDFKSPVMKAKVNDKEKTLYNPSTLNELDYDYCIVTIKNRNSANEVIEKLLAIGVPIDKIKWYDQKEVFWRFVNAYT